VGEEGTPTILRAGRRGRRWALGRIGRRADPRRPITDPDDPRVADFRDLRAGDRRPGTERGTGPVIVEGVPAVERLLASPYRVRRCSASPAGWRRWTCPRGPAYEADKWVLSR
jgi:hypothetical protein